MQGLDLSAHIANPALPGRPASVCIENALVVDRSRLWGVRPWWGVRTARYTYARHVEQPWLLFDNQADPYQLVNLAHYDRDRLVVEARLELDALVYQSFGRVGEPIVPEDEYAAICGVGPLWERRKAGWQ